MMVWTACIQTGVLFSTGVWSYQDCNVHLAYLLGMVSDLGNSADNVGITMVFNLGKSVSAKVISCKFICQRKRAANLPLQ